MLELKTLNDVFATVAARGDETVAQAQSGAEWTPITAKQMYGRVRAVAEKLQEWGIERNVDRLRRSFRQLVKTDGHLDVLRECCTAQRNCH